MYNSIYAQTDLCSNEKTTPTHQLEFLLKILAENSLLCDFRKIFKLTPLQLC